MAQIPLALLPEESHTHYRLLTLPDEILSMLTAPNPPTLHLKHGWRPAPGVYREEFGGEAALLCTHNTTYKISQVQSSNHVYVMQPEQTTEGEPRMVLTGICRGVLELTHNPEWLQNRLRKEFIRTHMPTYRSGDLPLFDALSDSLDREYGHLPETFEELVLTAPCSRQEFLDDCRNLCVFVTRKKRHGDLKGSWIWVPNGQALKEVWEQILRGADLDGLNLEDEKAAEEVGRKVVHISYPQGLVDAVLRRAGLIGRSGEFDRRACVLWVGTVLFDAQDPVSKKTLPDEFCNAWRDMLPEKWRAEVGHELLLVREFLKRLQVIVLTNCTPGSCKAASTWTNGTGTNARVLVGAILQGLGEIE
jgi:sister chromatid cohesion protein DCC1